LGGAIETRIPLADAGQQDDPKIPVEICAKGSASGMGRPFMYGIVLPTQFRQLSNDEWRIVEDVFLDTLPYHFRVWIGDGLGGRGAPFTIPTSAITAALLTAGISNPFILGGPLTSAPRALLGFAAGVTGSDINAGYIINVGTRYFPNLLIDDNGKETLVHEMTHVWQSKHKLFALQTTLAAAAAQCSGMAAAHGFSGRSRAYSYTVTTPLAPWGGFNPEQQAQIVEDWYRPVSAGKLVGAPGYGASKTAPTFPYIRDYIRRGRTA
jgi:hypothetical protein